eukprot:3103619-Ditylum_brightwellii.AAC.1
MELALEARNEEAISMLCPAEHAPSQNHFYFDDTYFLFRICIGHSNSTYYWKSTGSGTMICTSTGRKFPQLSGDV